MSEVLTSKSLLFFSYSFEIVPSNSSWKNRTNPGLPDRCVFSVEGSNSLSSRSAVQIGLPPPSTAILHLLVAKIEVCVGLTDLLGRSV